MSSRNSRIGLTLFLVYCLIYGGFVFINALSPDSMDMQPIDGINLAIVYGFALIIGAFLMALLYGLLCTAEDETEAEGEDKE